MLFRSAYAFDNKIQFSQTWKLLMFPDYSVNDATTTTDGALSRYFTCIMLRTLLKNGDILNALNLLVSFRMSFCISYAVFFYFTYKCIIYFP